MEICVLPVQNFSMAKRPGPIPKPPKPPQRRRHFVKEWRLYRKMTQEQLAERAGMTPNNLSQLENYRQNYSAAGLDALAAVLGCEPAHLLMVDPSKDQGMWAIWERANPDVKARIVAVATALLAEIDS